MTADQLTPTEGIRRELQRTVRGYITGERSATSRSASPDSWFGPDSITWLVHSDWSTIIGGVESLFVQTLHPPTMSGVADHSNYRTDPFGRLHRTAQFIGVTTYGSAAEAEKLVRRIRKIHGRVTGTTPAGSPYEANDPRNLGWVHATEVDGFLRAFQRYGAIELTNDESDRYVAEMATVGEALGVEHAPRSVAELEGVLESYVPELEYDKQAREAVRWLFLPPNKPVAQGAYLMVLGAALDLLPKWARRKLWLPPKLPFVGDRLAAPAAKTLIRTLDWIMEPPEEIARIKTARAS